MDEMVDFEERLRQKLQGIEKGHITLILTMPADYFRSVLVVLDVLVNEKDCGGVYMTVSKPHAFISRVLERENIPTKKLFFIDFISCMAGEKVGARGNCIFVENPASLEEISMYAEELIEKLDTPEKFLLLDSLSTLLIYNNAQSVKKFSHFLINKLRMDGMSGIFVTLEDDASRDLTDTLIHLCDSVINIR